MNVHHLWTYLKIFIFGYWQTFVSHFWLWVFKMSLYAGYIPWNINHIIQQDGKSYIINHAQLNQEDAQIDITVPLIMYMKFHSIHLLEDLEQYHPEWFDDGSVIHIYFYTDVHTMVKVLTLYPDIKKYHLSDMTESEPSDLSFGEILFEP